MNDPFVMRAWSDATGAGAAGIRMLGDAAGAFTQAVGMDYDNPRSGLFGRSKRYAMLVEDGAVTLFRAEESPGEVTVSGGEAILDAV